MSDFPQAQTDTVNINLLREWVTEAGYMALSARRDANVELKDDNTPVTSVDYQIEAFLLGRIAENYPRDSIISEEGGGQTGDRDFAWVVDPIDGTRAFASGLPIWGISVGVLYRGEPHVGVFYMPVVGEMYWNDNDRAYCNGNFISARLFEEFDNPLAFLAVPSNAHQIFEIDLPRVRSFGSTAAHLAYVARGAALAAVTRRVKIWDLAGVLPILNRAGGKLVGLSGNPLNLQSLLDGQPAPEPLVAAHFAVVDRVRSRIRIRRS